MQWFAAIATLVLLNVGTSWAGPLSWVKQQSTKFIMEPSADNETGFTLNDLMDRKILALVRHPLSPATLSQVGENVHRVPKRGIDFELLTPGDIGATIHFRW